MTSNQWARLYKEGPYMILMQNNENAKSNRESEIKPISNDNYVKYFQLIFFFIDFFCIDEYYKHELNFV